MRYLGETISFSHPRGEAALTPTGGVSWRIFSNPVSLGIGGIAAVILELAHPQVRHGVWDHSNFRTAPLRRMIRTAKAAMITVYAPAGTARHMIAQVNHMHRNVSGQTDRGIPYNAFDAELLNWVHATASFGFLEAYMKFVIPLTPEQRNAFYAEGKPVAALYGATETPDSAVKQSELFSRIYNILEPSDTLYEFLRVCEKSLPGPRFFTAKAVRSAVGLLPLDIVQKLSLDAFLPKASDTVWMRRAAWIAGTIPQYPLPFGQACRRMHISQSFLEE